MPNYTRAELKGDVNEAVLSGGRRTKAKPVREVLAEIIDSVVNNKDGATLETLLTYNSAFVITDSLALVYKSWVENNFAPAGDYLQQGSNTATQNFSFDLDGYLFSILNGDIDMNGNQINDVIIGDALGDRILEGRVIYESGGNRTADFQNATLGGDQPSLGWGNGTLRIPGGDNPTSMNWFDRALFGDWSIVTAGVSGIGFLIKNSSNQILHQISNDAQHVMSSTITLGDIGTVAEPNVAKFNIVTSELNRFQRFKNTSGSGHIFDIASNPTYKGLGFYNDNNSAYQLNIMQDGRNVYGGLPPLDDDAIHSFYGAAWFQDEIEILDSFIMTDTSDGQRLRVTITDRSFVFTEL